MEGDKATRCGWVCSLDGGGKYNPSLKPCGLGRLAGRSTCRCACMRLGGTDFGAMQLLRNRIYRSEVQAGSRP